MLFIISGPIRSNDNRYFGFEIMLHQRGSDKMAYFRDYGIYLFFLLLVKFHGSGGVDMDFSQKPSNPSYFNNGSDANLVWNYSDPHKVQSLLFLVLVNGTYFRMIYRDNNGVQEHPDIPPLYKGRGEIEGRATLVIKNINPQDNTEFRCELRGSFVGTIRNTVQLIVAEAPLINLSSGEKYYIEGSNVTIACEASGKPLPDVAWVRNGVLESSGKKVVFLKFNNIHRTDAGQYTCQANNLVGVTSIGTTIVVHYPPTIQNVTTSSKKSWIGQTVTLSCLSDGVPTPTLSWYKPEGSEINRVTARENKVQVPLAGDQDFGHYKCIAANGLIPSDEKLIKINQIKKPGKASIKSESVIQATSITIKWTAPADDGGSPITGFQVILRKDDKDEPEIKKINITDPRTKSYSFRGLEKDTNYTVKLFSRNFVFEGDPTVWNIRTKFEGAPDEVEIDKLPGETTDDTITLKWKEPESNGKVIIMYTVYQRVVTDGKVGQWTIIKKTSEVSVRELKITLKRGKVYQFAITATNELGESLKQEDENIQQVKAEGKPSPTKVSQSTADNEMDTAIYAGAAAAGVLLIIGVIVIIVLWKRRKVSSHENDEMPMDELRGSANHYEADDGYQEAAQSFQVSAPEAEANYAQVDMTKKKKNRRPPADEYAQVDKSKKTKKRSKRPGELDYAELDEFRRHDAGHARGPSGASAAAVVRPPAYEGTEYADITQFGVPQPDPTYANVSGGDVTYSNMQSIA